MTKSWLLEGETMKFSLFYQKLCSMLNEDGVLENVTIRDCTVTNVPRNYKIIRLGRRETFFGFVLFAEPDLFCGFPMVHGIVVGNNFVARRPRRRQ